MKMLFLLLSLFCTIVNGQNTLTGVVLDSKDHKPVANASVYISGTTKGAYTDAKGGFLIKDVVAPCQLVVSHVALNPQMIVIEECNGDKLTILMKEKSRQLNEVMVFDKNKREQNINDFKEAFLGNDRWGKNAILKNDSVLIFFRYTDTVKRKADSLDFVKQRKYKTMGSYSQWSADSAYIITTTPIFTAKARAPLLIELPLLGYTVYIDLVSFSLKEYKGWADCDTWAYYRFSSYSGIPSRKQDKIEKNRQDAYYNSAKHFCQSLFINELKENGYMIAAQIYNDSIKRSQRRFIDISTIVKYPKPYMAEISGLKDKKIYIYYFCKYNGKPTNLTGNKYSSDSSNNEWGKFRTDLDTENISEITFKSDACIIRSNGTIPDNNILFSGKIATKRAGALLPYDYIPDK